MGNPNYLKEGLEAQHVIFERIEWKVKNLPRYSAVESPEGSSTDMDDKIDITVYDTYADKSKYFDVKSSKHPDKISYTFINGLGESSKIHSGNFEIDLIFTFNTYNIGYFVRAEEFYKLLIKKINAGECYNGKDKPKSQYIWLSLQEIQALAYMII